MNISIASDHGGFALKERVSQYLKDKGYEVTDCGTYSSDSCDYPDFGAKAARLVSEGKCQCGIVICTTGIGIGIAANKIKGVRCALCLNTDMASITRKHNDANMLAMGAKYVTAQQAFEITDVFLSTDFEGGRHSKRVDKLMDLER